MDRGIRSGQGRPALGLTEGLIVAATVLLAMVAIVAEEAVALAESPRDFGVIAQLKLSRDVFREALRLYPPVPMMVREASCPERFRERVIVPGAQLVLSPWHLPTRRPVLPTF